MKHYLLNHQPQKGLQTTCAQQGQAPTCNARGKGRTPASPKTLTRILQVLLTMFLIPSAAWADYTYGGQPLTFYYPNDSDPSYYYSGSEDNKTIEWNAQLTNGAYNSSYSGYSAFSELRFTYANSITGLLSNIAIAGSTGSALQSATIKVYRLAAPDATDRTQIGTISNEEGTTYTYNPTEVVQGFNNEYIQLAIEPEEGKTNQCFYVNNINSITLTFSGEEYGISVGGHRVTSYNANNVLGDATSSSVSFDAENKKLTLNGASISSDIISSLEALTINLEGTNTLSGSISYSGSASNRTLAFTGDGSLEISGESDFPILSAFTSVNFGDFNLASQSTPGIHWESQGGSLRGFENIEARDVTITKDTYYPIWIYDSSLGSNADASHTQLNSDKLSVAVGNGTVSFDGKHTITISGASFNYGSNKMIVVGPDMPELTVHLLGASTGTNDATILYLWNATQLTFTTDGSNAGSLKAPIIVSWYEGSGQISCEDGLVYNAKTNPQTISTDGVRLKIGNTEVSASGSITTIDGASFDATYNTLTLTQATITEAIASNVNLTIVINGKNSISSEGVAIMSNDGNLTLTFQKGGEGASLRLTSTSSDSNNGVISAFKSVTADGMRIMGINATDNSTYKATYDSTSKTLVGENKQAIKDATIFSFLDGQGTEASPYLIKTAADLASVSDWVNNGTLTTEYLQLANDIVCSSLSDFTPIGNSNSNSFKGTFDGNNKTISSLTINSEETGGYVGLFGIVGNEDVSDAKIEKLTLSNCSFNGGEYVGGIVGEMVNGTIENCVLSSCTVKGGDSFNLYAGGIAGQVKNGTISTCAFNSGLVDGSTAYSGAPSTAYAGGIVGYIYSTNSVTVSSCTVSSTNVKSVTSGEDGAYNIYVGGLVGRSLGTVAISDNKITNTDNTKKISCQNINGTFTTYHCGAIIGEKGDETTLTNNTYEYDVTTEIAETPKSGYTQRGIGKGDGSCYDIPNQVMMAGTKKITISATALSDVRTLGLGEEMGSTYCLDERDASTDQLTALYVLPGNTISLVVSSENGYKPVFTLSSDVEVTPTEKYQDGLWTIQYEFSMPEDDVTATIAFAKDLESKNGDAFIYTLSAGQEAYPYTGEAIEPSISLTTDPQTPATLTKGTDYEIKDYFEVKEGVATPMYEEDGTTPKAPINVGSYKISITGKGNYFGTRELEFTIAKSAVDWSDNRWVAPKAKTDLKYTGADMELVTAATVPEGVTIKYYAKYSSTAFNSYDYSASQNEEWSEEVPTGKEIGYYAVFYKVEGGDNYLDWGPSEVGIDVNIDKGEVTISAEAQTVTYNAQQQAYTGASVDNENAALVIAYYTSEEDRTNALNALTGAPTDAGTYYVSVTLNEESLQHYTAEPANVKFTIAQLDISEAVITLDKEELTYNGEVQSVTVEKVMVGDIEVAADYYEVSGNTGTKAENYTLTVTAKKNSNGNEFKNNFMGNAEKAWKINHRTIPAEVIAEKFTSEEQTYASFNNASESFLAPQGIVAYIITGVSGNSVTVKAVSYIKAGTPVLLQKTSTSTETEETTDGIFATNILKYAEGDLTANGGQYVLYKNEFVKATGSITSGKCYLDLTGTSFAGTRGFSITGGAEGTTAISDAVADSDHSEWFDLQGRKIEKPSKKGLYIRDGKKIVVK